MTSKREKGPGRVRLALDTSTPVGAVALAVDGHVVARARLTSQTRHASALLPAVDEALSAAGVDRHEIDAVIVGEGPGSFTGVRVAAATAKGLTRALQRPLYAVSSLAGAALAHEALPIRYALFDARAERVYAACFGVGRARVEVLAPPHAAELRELLAGDVPAGATFLGDGALKHRGVIEGAGFPVAEPGPDMTVADGLLAWLVRSPNAAPVLDPSGWEPEYVRVSGAERLWAS